MTRKVFEDITPLYGFHDVEKDSFGPVVWTSGDFGFRVPAGNGCYTARMCYYGDNGKLLMGESGRWKREISLYRGWNTYPLDMRECTAQDVDFKVDPVIPVEGDERELGLMVRFFRKLGHNSSMGNVRKVLDNKVKNEHEFARGRRVLTSFPRILRISVESRCNIKPPCVYCHWDRARDDESRSDFRFSRAVLEELGGFYECAEEIGELGHGEPLLNPDFVQIVEEIGAAGKHFSFASNGLLLDSLRGEKMLGKDIELYISIDASNAASYARYRDDKFKPLIKNLRSLCRKKKKHKGLPAVIASFIAMRSNVSEFEDFLDLMKAVGVDGVRVMNLDVYPDLVPRVEKRDGFEFIYEKERLSFPELNVFISHARSEAAKRAVPFFSVMDFEQKKAKDGSSPICSEPWKGINILNRGLTMCCNNKVDTVAEWSERGERSLERFVRDVWNGKRYQEARESLASGRLPEYCLRSGSCPIVHHRLDAGNSAS